MRDKILKELENLYTFRDLTPEDAKDFLGRLKQYYDICPEELKRELDSGISYCEREIQRYIFILRKAEQQSSLSNIVDKFSSSKGFQIRYNESDKNPVKLLVDIDSFVFHLEYNWKQEIWVSVWHKTKTYNNEETAHPIFPKADELKPFVYERLKFVKGKYILNSSFETWPNDIEVILSNIRKNISALPVFLDNYTFRFPDGTMKVKRNLWKSPARIKGIIQKSRYGVESDFEERYYVLRIKILRPSQENYEPFAYDIEIEDFIRKQLLPKLQRERMSTKLEEEINSKLRTIKAEVITHDFDEDGAVSADATYLPLGFKSWDEYLRSVFKKLLDYGKCLENRFTME